MPAPVRRSPLRRAATCRDAAVADFGAALKLQPKDAWSLYGRGVAEQRKGDRAEGDADIAAAVALDPKLLERARALGLAA